MESYEQYSRRAHRPPPGEPWQRLIPLIPWAIGLIFLFGLLFDASYTVEPHEQAVVLRFGKYHATTMPGLHFKLPMVDQVMKVSVEEHGLRLPFGCRIDRRRTSRIASHEDETLMLTGDLNTASVEWTVQWKVTEPDQYLFRFPRETKDAFAEDLITFVARTVMNRLVGDYSFDEVIGPKRGDIANDAAPGHPAHP